jgi:hypothetical protein
LIKCVQGDQRDHIKLLDDRVSSFKDLFLNFETRNSKTITLRDAGDRYEKSTDEIKKLTGLVRSAMDSVVEQSRMESDFFDKNAQDLLLQFKVHLDEQVVPFVESRILTHREEILCNLKEFDTNVTGRIQRERDDIEIKLVSLIRNADNQFESYRKEADRYREESDDVINKCREEFERYREKGSVAWKSYREEVSKYMEDVHVEKLNVKFVDLSRRVDAGVTNCRSVHENLQILHESSARDWKAVQLRLQKRCHEIEARVIEEQKHREDLQKGSELFKSSIKEVKEECIALKAVFQTLEEHRAQLSHLQEMQADTHHHLQDQHLITGDMWKNSVKKQECFEDNFREFSESCAKHSKLLFSKLPDISDLLAVSRYEQEMKERDEKTKKVHARILDYFRDQKATVFKDEWEKDRGVLHEYMGDMQKEHGRDVKHNEVQLRRIWTHIDGVERSIRNLEEEKGGKGGCGDDVITREQGRSYSYMESVNNSVAILSNNIVLEIGPSGSFSPSSLKIPLQITVTDVSFSESVSIVLKIIQKDGKKILFETCKKYDFGAWFSGKEYRRCWTDTGDGNLCKPTWDSKLNKWVASDGIPITKVECIFDLKNIGIELNSGKIYWIHLSCKTEGWKERISWACREDDGSFDKELYSLCTSHIINTESRFDYGTDVHLCHEWVISDGGVNFAENETFLSRAGVWKLSEGSSLELRDSSCLTWIGDNGEAVSLALNDENRLVMRKGDSEKVVVLLNAEKLKNLPTEKDFAEKQKYEWVNWVKDIVEILRV